jgi:hypothetical protein
MQCYSNCAGANTTNMHIEHIQQGSFYPYNHIFRCYFFNQPDILDLEDWCEQCVSGHWYRSAVVYDIGVLFDPCFFELFFDDAADAILFKLTWM